MLGFRESFKTGGPQGFVRSSTILIALILMKMLLVSDACVEISMCIGVGSMSCADGAIVLEPRVVLSSHDSVPLELYMVVRIVW